MIAISQFFTFISSKLQNNIATQSLVNVLMKNPFASFPQDNRTYLNFPDAVHFLRGAHNMKVRNF
jgi:hypothetical protein